MTVAVNSLIAFESIKPELTKRESEVYEIVKANPGITIRDVAEKMKTYPNCISGRFSALEEKKAIKIEGTHYYPGSIQPHSKYRVV